MTTNRVPPKDITQQHNYNLNKHRSNSPPNIKFVQQRLPTYHPVLDTAHVLPTLFLLSAIFIPLGIGIWLFSENIQEITIPYTECKSLEHQSLTCEEVLHGNQSMEAYSKEKVRNVCTAYEGSNKIQDCRCRVNFTLENDMNGTVYMFYALTNFNQNHLRYYTSRDENQLRGKLGEISDLKKPSSSCYPCDYEFADRDERLKGRIIFPCGLQANTMFNDVIDLIHVDPERYPLHIHGESPVPLNRTGIAWGSDVDKFENPKLFTNTKHPMWTNFTKPWGWKKSLWELDRNRSNNGLQNEDFIVWMRTAAFPNFRKLYRIVDSTCIKSPFKYGLPAGNYSLFIKYNYEVTSFKGTKSIVITTTRISGGRNHFLGVAYMVVGGILMVLTITFFGIYIWTRKRDSRKVEFKEN